MKFAKELQQDLVPEWRAKYFDYKVGKKHVKAVARAYSRAPQTPYTPATRSGNRPRGLSRLQSTPVDENTSLRGSPAQSGSGQIKNNTKSRAIPAGPRGDNTQISDTSTNDMHYGSFGLTPPLSTTPNGINGNALSRSNTLELPAPAMNAPEDDAPRATPHRRLLNRSVSEGPRSSHNSDFPTPTTAHTIGPAGARLHRQPTTGPDGGGSPRHRLQRMFTSALTQTRSYPSPEIGMQGQALDAYHEKEEEFFEFLDAELDKVETFYKLKENQAGERLAILRDQLHKMGSMRRQELREDSRQRKAEGNGATGHGRSQKQDVGYIDQVRHKIFKPGPNSRALSKMDATPVLRPQSAHDEGRDYTRRPEDESVSYRTAKRKLKLALQEFYRGLELLKAYALLNRTAFRKINKKYDKAINARPPYRYMNEKVNKTWFVNSDVLETYIKAVEDLYSDFFERGKHKIAVGKLKSLTRPRGDESGSAFRAGILIGTGAVFAVQGLTFGCQLLFHDDGEIVQQTSYLMQIYGGYFLMLFLFALFTINCWIWTDNKVNYPFIFEFDQRHHLDWRQLAEFPSFFLLLLGLFMWLNFSRYGSEDLYLYYPVILIGLSAMIILCPFPVLAPSSRKWFAYAHWRLLLAGFYPVEFRDFFLGDIYCSLTYAVCNISLFFCLYANDWDNPIQCNSNHSRLLGFFGALPPIWRFLQCLRRYKDTRSIFPHLVNGGKYTMSIMAAVALSLFRISASEHMLALFIVFALINAVYTSIWDIFMDFSLLQADSRNRFLRDILGLKKKWIYYVIMVVDPILRFAWIFYAIFTHDRQHSTIVSFLVGFAEVFRRGIWALLRVENEHCANTRIYKASRDVPLPYTVEPLTNEASEASSSTAAEGDGAESRTITTDGSGTTGAAAAGAATATSTGIQRQHTQATVQDEEAGVTSPTATNTNLSGTVKRRKTFTQTIAGGARSFSKMLAEAHRQDFQKKVKPAGEEAEEAVSGGPAVHSDQSDDDDDDDDDERDERRAGMNGDIPEDNEDGASGSDERANDEDVEEAKELSQGRAGDSSRP